jgi:hypothetical protein
MDYSGAYWFGRGYYDGRANGVGNMEPARAVSDTAVVFYTAGYDAGVSDYCELDLEGGE